MQPSLNTPASLLIQLRHLPDDGDAWNQFVRIYSPHVLRWCRLYGLSANDAEDVAQDVLIRFWRQAGSFEYDPARRFRSYLRRIVVSALSNWLAARRRQPQPGPAKVDELLNSVPAREDLVARLEQAYDQELLEIAMQRVEERVQPHTWKAFELLAIDGISGREVAQQLAMEVNTAYVARKKVQRMIREVVVELEAGEAVTQ